jgi:Cd2+/Zn2+-exporting ATPase
LLGADWFTWIYRGLSLLLIACPCALVISTPAAIASGLASGARHGLLIKGGAALETLGMVRTVAFDKTGTLTEGQPRFTQLVTLHEGWDDDTIMAYAASVENLSEHPIARAIVDAANEQGIPFREVRDFRSVTGRGVIAKVADGQGGWKTIGIGNEELFADMGAGIPADAVTAAEALRSEGQTTMFLGSDDSVQGILAVADRVRPQAAATIAKLKELGIKRTVMLTGDNERVARAIAEQVGIDEIYAELMPEQKLDIIRNLEASDQKVAMVGDGVNDAPALATATVGIAMGGAGSDVALETADVVLMSDDLTRLPTAVGLSRRTRRTMIHNLTFALSVIAVLVISTLTVGIPLPLGVVGHEGSTVIVVLNGLRLLGYKDA